VVGAAKTLEADILAARRQASALDAEGTALLEVVPPWAGEDQKGPAWRSLDTGEETAKVDGHRVFVPAPPEGNERRVIRGGYWNGPPGGARCAVRGGLPPSSRLALVGARLVRSLG
jgi:hypothetical protein